MGRGIRLITGFGAVAIVGAGDARAQPGEIVGPLPQGSAVAEVTSGAEALPIAESKPLGGGASTPATPAFSRFAAPRGESAGHSTQLRAGEGWWRTAGALAIVVALIVAVSAGVRAWARRSGGLLQALGPGGRAPSGVLQVLGRYPVGRAQTLILLKLDRRVLLVSQSGGVRAGGMQTLCELTEPEEVASILMLTAEAEGRTLAAKFREAVSGYEKRHEEAERVLAPVAVVERLPASAAGDPLGSLRSRLHSLRGSDEGTAA